MTEDETKTSFSFSKCLRTTGLHHDEFRVLSQEHSHLRFSLTLLLGSGGSSSSSSSADGFFLELLRLFRLSVVFTEPEQNSISFNYSHYS